jgi:hypothetical protein
MSEKTRKIIVKLSAMILAGFILAYPLMLLWNWLMPAIFGLVEVNYWQGVGLWILSGIFFREGK